MDKQMEKQMEADHAAVQSQIARQLAQQLAPGNKPNLAKAYTAFWGEVRNVEFDARNPHLKNQYATLYAVLAVIKPAAAKHGLAFLQVPGRVTTSNHMEVITQVIHASGETWTFTSTLPFTDAGWNKKADRPNPVGPQQGAGTISYLKRYILMALAGICGVEDDDDGNGGGDDDGDDSDAMSVEDKAAVSARIEAFALKKREAVEAGLERMKTELEADVQATGDEDIVKAYVAKRKAIRALSKTP